MKKYFYAVIAAIMVLAPAAVFANENTPTPIDVDSVFTGVTTSVSDAITTLLPYAAAILGAFLAIQIGLKIYRRVVGR